MSITENAIYASLPTELLVVVATDLLGSIEGPELAGEIESQALAGSLGSPELRGTLSGEGLDGALGDDEIGGTIG